MFGSGSGGTGGFGGFGQNQQQQPQQTGTGGVFGGGGTAGGFGSTTTTGTGFGQTGTGGGFGTGTGGGFGQPQQQSTGFGGTGFGSTANTGFGAKPFGTTTAGTGTGLFGSTPAATTTGFGTGFGTAAATTGGFGTTTTPASTAGGFGKPFGATTTTAGTTGGLFGTAPAANTGFGAGNTIGFGSTASTDVPVTGTSNPVFTATQEKDPAGSSMNHFQTISFMPAYQKFSLEELRLQDYLQGRRYGNATPGGAGAFGINTGFGGGFGTQQQQPQQQGAGFGATGTTGGLFGTQQPQQQQQTGFGATSTTGFPTSTGAGLFGTKPAGTGLFGTTPAAPAAGGGIFGNQTQGGTGFGSTGSTGFGTQSTPAVGGGLFGSTPANTSSSLTTGSTGFGQQPQTGFGATQQGAGGGLFGNQQTTTSTPFGTTQPAATTTPFGTGFGQTAQAQPQQTPFGTGFGANPQQQQNKPFGTGFGATTPATGTGLFANTQQQQQQPTQGGGLFGTKPGFGAATTPVTGSGLFGSTPATGATTGGLFSGGQQTQPAQGGMFGGVQQNQQQQNTGGLFGTKPNTGGLFGGGTTTPASNTGGLFSGSILGSGQQQGTFSGNQQQQPPNMGASGFFNSTMSGQPGQQQQFSTSSISDIPYGPNPLLGGSVQGAPGPLATPIASVQKKKAAMLPQSKIAPRMTQIAPRPGASFSRAGSPFASTSSGGTPLASSTLGRSLSSSTSKLHLFDNDDSVLSAGAFTPSSGSRVASLKRLVIDRNIRDADLFTGGSDLKGITGGKDDGKPKGILKKSVSFDANNSSRNYADLFGKEQTPSSSNRQYQTTSPSAEDTRQTRPVPSIGHRESGSQEDFAHNNGTEEHVVQGNEVAIIGETPQQVDEKGTYWMSPNLATLKAMPKDKLKHVTNLTVGRRGYGQVRFEPAVDLTNIPPEDIMDGIVSFQSRVCTVYPEHLPKPPPGKGLNVPSIISLEDCFPQYKDTRGPVKNPEHPRYIAHLNRLKSIKDTEFVDYLATEGIWTFKVQHFTTYGLVDSDDEEQEGSYEEEDGTPRQSAYYYGSSMLSEQSFSGQSFDGDADISGVVSDSSSAIDDTFEFRKLRSSVASSVGAPGAFAGSAEEESYEGGSTAEEDTTIEMHDQEVSFLGEGSTGSGGEEEEEEVVVEEDLDEDEEPVEPEYTEEEIDESVVIQSGAASPAEAACAPVLSPAGRPAGAAPTSTTPKALPIAKNWADQLNMTISPVKRRTKMIMMSPLRARSFDFSSQKEQGAQNGISGPLDYGHLDIMNDLFSGVLDNVGGLKEKEIRSPMKKGQVQESPRQPQTSVRTITEDECNAKVRPVWTAQGKLLYVGELVDAPRVGRPAAPKASQLKVSRTKYIAEKPTELAAMFDLLLKCSDIKLDSYKVPFAEVKPDTTFEQFTEIPWDDKPSSRYEKSAWRLASVLFDPIENPDPMHIDDMYYDNKTRKEKLTRFLEDSVARTVDYHARTAASAEEKALAHLTGHRIEQACAALLEGNCYRLAILVSMVGGDHQMREDITQQLVEWKVKGYLAEISLQARALYELLAGNTCFSDGLKKPYEDAAPSFFIPQHFSLDWKRAFGLKLWYGTTEEQSIGDAVALYEQDFLDKYPGDVQKPTPWYAPDDAESEQYDILWGLLKILADERVPLQNVLTTKWAEKTHDDFRLPWQLWSLMSRRGIRDFSVTPDQKAHGITPNERAHELTVNFAAQLEAQGHWHRAIFILMHLLDTDARELGMKALLARHVGDLEDGNERLAFMKETLLVPDKWINEAKALHARHMQLHVSEAEYLLLAHAWAEAHRTLVQQVAPSAVISGDLEQLRNLLAKFEDVNKVENWTLGGQVYLDYITLLNLKDDLPTAIAMAPAPTGRGPRAGSTALGRNDLVAVCKRLLGALPNMEQVHFEQKVAVREMGAVVSGVILKVGGTLADEAPRILDLPLTEDQYLKKTVRLSLEYYKARLVEVR